MKKYVSSVAVIGEETLHQKHVPTEVRGEGGTIKYAVVNPSGKEQNGSQFSSVVMGISTNFCYFWFVPLCDRVVHSKSYAKNITSKFQQLRSWRKQEKGIVFGPRCRLRTSCHRSANTFVRYVHLETFKLGFLRKIVLALRARFLAEFGRFWATIITDYSSSYSAQIGLRFFRYFD